MLVGFAKRLSPVLEGSDCLEYFLHMIIANNGYDGCRKSVASAYCRKTKLADLPALNVMDAKMKTPTKAEPGQIAALLELCRRAEAEGRVEEAVASYRNWLKGQPNANLAYLVWYEFGRLLHKQGDNAKAENAFKAALEQRPDYDDAALALGIALESQGKADEAIAAWQSAIPPESSQIQLLNNIARLQDKLHRAEESEKALISSLKLDHNQQAVLTTLLHQRQRLCRWPVISADIGIDTAVQESSVGPLMSLALIDNPEANLASVTHFLESSPLYQPLQPLAQRGQFYPGHTRLKVGFLSADFRLHATSVFFGPLISGLDRERFEVYALDITTADDPFVITRQSLISSADHHVPLQSLTDIQAAHRIRELEIDILVDLAGLTSGARPSIVGSRPAPLQIAYIGFLASCGMSSVDYIVTTEDLFPKSGKRGFTEKPLYLPDVYLTVEREIPPEPPTTRAECGLADDAMVYCALLNSYKITPEVFKSWMNILKAVPGSVLWLVEENPTTRRNLEASAEAHGVDASRLHFSPRVHPAQYRSRLAVADIFLDTSPYGNGATARDAVLAGLPILTKPGNTMMSRLAAHIMKSLGLKPLVTADLDTYEALAIKLGNDKKLIAKYRQKMLSARKDSPLFDRDAFVIAFGDALLRAVDESKVGQPIAITHRQAA